MKSIALKRSLVWLMVLTTGSLPIFFPMACLSGAEQETIQNAILQTGTDYAATAAAGAIPQNVAGDGGVLDAMWNGGTAAAVDLVEQTANNWIALQVDRATPDDPFH